MKNVKYFFLFILLIAFGACTDPIDVDLVDAGPRLTIEASIDWHKGTDGSDQMIKLSNSQPYFDTVHSLAVTGANVRITNTRSNEVFVFVDQNDGTYTTSSFVPVLGDPYTIEIIYNGDTYVGSEIMTPFSGIKRVDQSVEGGFDDELIEITTYWDDPVDEENYYIVRYDIEGELLPDYEWYSDEFINGNEIDDFYEKDDDDADTDESNGFMEGEVFNVKVIGASERYYNYMNILLEQYFNSGNPYSPTPAQVKGNCVNTTNEANYPFGYFRVSEVDTREYIVQ